MGPALEGQYSREVTPTWGQPWTFKPPAVFLAVHPFKDLGCQPGRLGQLVQSFKDCTRSLLHPQGLSRPVAPSDCYTTKAQRCRRHDEKWHSDGAHTCGGATGQSGPSFGQLKLSRGSVQTTVAQMGHYRTSHSDLVPEGHANDFLLGSIGCQKLWSAGA